MAAPSSGLPQTHEQGLDIFRALGGNCLHLHGEGGETHSRVAVGAWLKAHSLRNEFVLCSQICHDEWDDRADRPVVMFNADGVLRDITNDLELIGTEYLDIVYLDDHPELPFQPVFEELGRMISAGRIRAVGVRNWASGRLAAACEYAEQNAGFSISALVTTELALPVSTSPLWPGYQPFDIERKESVSRYSLNVFAHVGDYVSGQYVFGGDDAFSVSRPEWRERWENKPNEEIARLVGEICAKRNVSPRAVCMAWLLHQDALVIPIIALSELLEPRHTEYLAGLRLDLTSQELDALNGLRWQR